jgi:acyl-CoA synthetase (AMP-forming)/AMP-acid ligase II
MAVAADARAPADSAAPGGMGAIPRDYNFAADILDRNLKAGRGGKHAFIDPRENLSFGELSDRVARFAAALRALGVQREQRVLICLLDTVDWPVAFLGCLKAGVVAVPVNTLMTEDDYRFMLADSRARALVVSEALYPRFERLIGEAPDLATVIVAGDGARGHTRFEELIEGARPDPATASTMPI